MKSVSRRKFMINGGKTIAAAGAATQLGWLAACAPSSTSTSSTQWQELAKRIKGKVLLPGEALYKTSAQPYNVAYANVRPHAIAMCAVPEDALECVSWARENAVPFTIMSGGHSYAGFSTNPSFIIDMANLNSINADASTGAVMIGVGVRNEQLFSVLPPLRLGLPHGRCPNTGVGGFVLGGGFGFTTRSMGMLCDNMVETQVVTASGEMLTCNQNENSDLYWACRGGAGGNFGITTYYKMQTHPLPAEMSVYQIQWEWSQAMPVLEAMQQLMLTAPDEFGCRIGLDIVGKPGGQKTLSVEVIGEYLGPVADLKNILTPILGITGQTSQTIQSATPSSAVTFLAENVPFGCFASKSSYSAVPLTNAACAQLVSMLEKWPGSSNTGGAGVAIFCLGGAANKVASNATAYVHRSAKFLVNFEATWMPADSSSVSSAGNEWLGQIYSSVQSYVLPQSYQNWPDRTLSNWESAYYDTNLAQLVQVKKKYDPDNVFHFPQSVPLST